MRTSAGFAWSARTLYLAIGLAGLALAVASIADMFAPRPYDGIVPAPYSRGGIEVRASVSGGPAESAGIRAGDCVLGIGKRLVNSTSDASASNNALQTSSSKNASSAASLAASLTAPACGRSPAYADRPSAWPSSPP